MTYASGGLIQASDFNNLNGASAGTQGGGTQINPIWATGSGNYGYGQTAISNVSVAGTVAATNWASMINAINNARSHQGGSTSLTAPTAGSTVTYLSTLSSAISTAATNRLAFTIGSNTNNVKTVVLNAAANTAVSGAITWTATFASVDQARYFFNAGGTFDISYSSFTNTGGTSRGTSIQTLAQTNYGSKQMVAAQWFARTGAGGTVVTDTTTGGYYGLTTGSTTYCKITSTSYYSGDYIQLNASTNGTAGSYSANGNIVTIVFTAYSGTTGAYGPLNDSINVTLGMNLNIIYPETTYLTNSWGTVTVA